MLHAVNSSNLAQQLLFGPIGLIRVGVLGHGWDVLLERVFSQKKPRRAPNLCGCTSFALAFPASRFDQWSMKAARLSFSALSTDKKVW
jgi:hypothetical protein